MAKWPQILHCIATFGRVRNLFFFLMLNQLCVQFMFNIHYLGCVFISMEKKYCTYKFLMKSFPTGNVVVFQLLSSSRYNNV